MLKIIVTNCFFFAMSVCAQNEKQYHQIPMKSTHAHDIKMRLTHPIAQYNVTKTKSYEYDSLCAYNSIDIEYEAESSMKKKNISMYLIE